MHLLRNITFFFFFSYANIYDRSGGKRTRAGVLPGRDRGVETGRSLTSRGRRCFTPRDFFRFFFFALLFVYRAYRLLSINCWRRRRNARSQNIDYCIYFHFYFFFFRRARGCLFLHLRNPRATSPKTCHFIVSDRTLTLKFSGRTKKPLTRILWCSKKHG